MSQLTITTRAVRAGIAVDAEHGAVVPPIHLTSTFAFERFGRPRTFDYTRSGNPTREHLAGALADLEQGAGAVVTNTGMSAVHLVLQLARPGDTVVAAHDCYGGTQRLLRALAERGQFTLRFADLSAEAPGGVETAPLRGARIVWIETPSNPLLRITDVRRICAAARAAGALVVVDNTFLSPVWQQPLSLGADVVVHSTTKYLNGHSDVVGGAAIARDRAVHDELAWWANCLGASGAPFDSFLTLRGLRTLVPRMRQHEANASAVVEAIASHAAVSRLYYPGLAGHAGHEVARGQQQGFGAMVSLELTGGQKAVAAFVEHLRCFTLAESLGGVESLVAHPATMTHASMTAEARAAAGISDALVRLSVGIEDADDLARDLTAALDASLRSAATASRASSRKRGARRDVVLLGAGAIGRELLHQLEARADELRVCAIADRSGYIVAAGGIERHRLRALRALKQGGGRLVDSREATCGPALSLLHALSRTRLRDPVLVDATAADTSELLHAALARGFDLVLANKVPLAADIESAEALWDAARATGRVIRHEATVGAGLPVIDTLHKLVDAGDHITCIEGCPSGTLGYLFAELTRGRRFSDVVRDAVSARLTEPDPRIDLAGIDVARKALILARLVGFRGNLSDVVVESLVPAGLERASAAEFLDRLHVADDAWRRRLDDAQRSNVVLRYRARATPTSVTVGLAEVADGDPLGSLSGTDNQFAFTTTRYHDTPLIIRGPGAGPGVTAAGVLNDLLGLAGAPSGPRASSPAVAQAPAVTSS